MLDIFKNEKDIKEFLNKEIIWDKNKLSHKIIFSKFYTIIMSVGFFIFVIPGSILFTLRNNIWKKQYPKIIKNIQINKCAANFLNNNVKIENEETKEHYFNKFMYKKRDKVLDDKELLFFKFFNNDVRIVKTNKCYKINFGNNSLATTQVQMINMPKRPPISTLHYLNYATYPFFQVNEKKINKKYKDLDLFIMYVSPKSKDGKYIFYLLNFFRKKDFINKNTWKVKSNNDKLANEFLTNHRKEKIFNFIKNQKKNWTNDLRILITDQKMIIFNRLNFNGAWVDKYNYWAIHSGSKKAFIDSFYKNMKHFLEQTITTAKFYELNKDLWK